MQTLRFLRRMRCIALRFAPILSPCEPFGRERNALPYKVGANIYRYPP